MHYSANRLSSPMLYKSALQKLELYKYVDPIPESAYYSKVVLFTLKPREGTTNATKAKSAFLIDHIKIMEQEDFYNMHCMGARGASAKENWRQQRLELHQQAKKRADSQGTLQAAITCRGSVRPRLLKQLVWNQANI